MNGWFIAGQVIWELGNIAAIGMFAVKAMRRDWAWVARLGGMLGISGFRLVFVSRVFTPERMINQEPTFGAVSAL